MPRYWEPPYPDRARKLVSELHLLWSDMLQSPGCGPHDGERKSITKATRETQRALQHMQAAVEALRYLEEQPEFPVHYDAQGREHQEF